MEKVDGERPLAELCLPGTHDTMTATCDHPFYRTQSLSLMEQLEAGVRYVDLRLKRNLFAAHREWQSNITGSEIFDEMTGFLREHPSEVIIARVQNANERKDDFMKYGRAMLDLVANYQEFFPEWESDRQPWGSVGDYRGKIVAFECAPEQYGFTQIGGHFWAQAWHNNPTLLIQDLWEGPDLEEKWSAIREAMGTDTDERLVLNHVSATLGELGNPLGYAQELNPRVAELFKEKQGEDLSLRGVQIFDFVTPELARATVEMNLR